MSYSTLGTVNWGTGPVIPVTVSYDSQRSGRSMQYRIRVSFAAITGASYFGYPIYLSLTLDGTSAVSGYTVKAASPNQWNSAITYDSGWVNVSNKTGGTTSLKVRIYSGSGSSRDNTYTYSLPVSDYYVVPDWDDDDEDDDEPGGTAPVVEKVRPSASLSVSVVNDNAAAAAWGICIQGLSKLRYVISAQAHGFAIITSYSFGFAGQTLRGFTGTTALINASGALTPTATVTDSNGLRTTVSGEPVQVYAYSAPRIRSSFAWRCDSAGNETDEGAYLRVSCTAECSGLGGRNSVRVRARYRPIGGQYGSYTELQNGVTATIGGGLDRHTTYEVELSAVDSVGTERSISYTSSTAAVALHLRQGGNGAAFGKYAESDALECAWDASFSGDVTVAGELDTQTLRVGNKTLLDMVYPIGAIYLSTAATDPGALFGGGWQAIRDRFLLAAGNEFTALSTGGAKTHTLTVQEMPAHKHTITVNGDGEHSHYIENYASVGSSGSGVMESWGSGSGTSRNIYTDEDGYHSHSASASQTGGGTAFNLMPPYLTVYMWKRIS